MEAFLLLIGCAIICGIFLSIGIVAILKFLICWMAALWLHEKVISPFFRPKNTPPIGAFVRYVPDDDWPPPPDEPTVDIPPPPPPGRALLPPRPPRRGRHNQRTCRSEP